MPKFKRQLVPGEYLTAADMLHTLGQQQLVAAALQSTIVLAAEPAVAWLLDRCCFGRPVLTAAANGDSDSVGHSSSNISSAAQLAAAAAAVGVNRASQEVLLHFEQHQAQQLARKQRRARRTPSYVVTAGITAPAATPGQPAAAAAAAAEAAQELGGQQDEDQATAAADAADVDESALAIDGGPGNGWPAGLSSGSGFDLPISEEELQQLQLVQLSCQEAFFLAHVLNCCSVFDMQQDVAQEHHHQQQQQLVAREEQSHAQEEQQQQQQHQQQQQQPPQQQQVQGPLAPAELWRWCCSAAPGGALQFMSRYAAYKHFRSKGWLPLPGLLYGADYALYKLHPEWAHSDFLVMVMVERPAAAVGEAAGGAAAGQHNHHQQQERTLSKSSGSGSCVEQQQFVLQTGDAASSTQLTWLDAHIMQRLARQVLKQLLLLYVVIPPGLQLGSLECMQHVTVREVLLQRWVPSEHREDGKA